MNNKSSEDNSRTGFIIAFIVVAVLSVICCIFVNSLIKKNNADKKTSDTSASVTTDVSAESTSSEVTEDVDSIEILTEELVSNLNVEFNFSDSLISYTGTKTFPFALSKVLSPGDILEKVEVTYAAEDENTIINELKGGFGFNVTKDGISDSQNRSDSDEWFQGEEFHVTPGSNEYTYHYVIPESVREKLDYNGECQAGYWYGQLDKLRITKIVFFKTPYVKKFEYNQKASVQGTINDFFIANALNDKLNFKLKDFSIPQNSQIQCISLKITADNPLDMISGKFSIPECENISIDRFYMQEQGNTAIINLFINPSDANSIDVLNHSMQFSINNDNNTKLDVDTVTVYYLTPAALKKLSS